jgi:hypothetical protein
MNRDWMRAPAKPIHNNYGWHSFTTHGGANKNDRQENPSAALHTKQASNQQQVKQ